VDISSNGYVVAGSEDGEVYFFDTSGKLWSYETDGEVRKVKISIDGRYVIARDSKGKCYFSDSSGNLIWSTSSYSRGMAMSPDGRFVVVKDCDKIEFFDNSDLIGAKTCPYCHQKLPHELLKVCPFCFKELPWADQIKDDTKIWGLDEEPSTATKPDAQTVVKANRCPHCGYEITDTNARFCPYCGGRLR
jgi:WD40 repeat protein